jgi:curli biogenesis system outer membrane secretion channel CsgG
MTSMNGTKARHLVKAILALMLVIGLAGSAQAQGKVRVAVLDFANNSTWSWWGDNLGSAAADELTTQLVKTGRFTVVERAQLGAVLAEQDLGQSGAVTAATAAKIGKILGVQFLLAGSITQFSIERTSAGYRGIGGTISTAESMMDVRLINTETAEVMAVAEGKGTKRMGGGYFKGAAAERTFDQGAAQEALRPAVEQVVQRVAAQSNTLASVIPAAPEGQIVSTREGLFYINRGQNAGVKVGQRFDVMRVVDEIKDADGRLLDRVIDKVGTLEVTQVLSQSAICKLITGQAAVKDSVK